MSEPKRQSDPGEQTEDRLFRLVDTLLKNFQQEMNSFRWELRFIVALTFLALLARDGVMGKVKIPGFSVETMAAEAAEPAGESPSADE